MADNQNIITQIADINAIKKNLKEVETLLLSTINTVSKSTNNLLNFKDVSKNLQIVKNAEKELIDVRRTSDDVEKQRLKLNNEIVANYHNYDRATQELIANEVVRQKSIRDTSKEVRELLTNEQDLNKILSQESVSIEKLDAQNRQLQAIQRKLNLTTKEGIRQNELINKRIAENTVIIKQNTNAVDAQRRNVGNYSSALQGLSKVYGVVRKAAYILPGLGISGIFLFAINGLKELGSLLGITEKITGVFSDKVQIAEKSIRGFSKALDDQYNKIKKILDDKIYEDLAKGLISVSEAEEKLSLTEKESLELSRIDLEKQLKFQKNYLKNLNEAVELVGNKFSVNFGNGEILYSAKEMERAFLQANSAISILNKSLGRNEIALKNVNDKLDDEAEKLKEVAKDYEYLGYVLRANNKILSDTDKLNFRNFIDASIIFRENTEKAELFRKELENLEKITKDTKFRIDIELPEEEIESLDNIIRRFRSSLTLGQAIIFDWKEEIRGIQNYKEIFINSLQTISSSAISAFNNIYDSQLQVFQNERDQLDKNYAIRENLLRQTISDENELNSELARLANEKLANEEVIARKEAEIERRKAILEIAVSNATATAEAAKLFAVAATAAAPGDPYSVAARIAAAIAAAAVVVSTIASTIAKIKSIPQYYMGGDVAENSIISVAERGYEIGIGKKSGKKYMFDSQAVIKTPEAMTIYSHEKSAKMIEKQPINTTNNRTENINLTLNIDNQRIKKYFTLN